MKNGIIGKKIGMTQIFNDDGTVDAVTAIEAGPCVITQIKTREKDGYTALQLGYSQAKQLNLPEKKHLGELGLFKHLREFRINDIEGIEVGQVINSSIFKVNDLVNISGVSKGRGFAGVVKRHHFSGGPKTHGQSDRWRAPGSIGATTTPGRVFKGMRMAGHMGNANVTVKNLRIVKVDSDRNLVLVNGAIPGANNGLVMIKISRSAEG